HAIALINPLGEVAATRIQGLMKESQEGLRVSQAGVVRKGQHSESSSISSSKLPTSAFLSYQSEWRSTTHVVS
ncbi:hypothetical protein HAX54_024855, partial [Datura stramonium]|nr:hypothetical protein [Datura stramonium]